MFKAIKEFFTGKPAAESKFAHPLDAVTTPNTTAPYKVPEPESMMIPIPLKIESPAVETVTEIKVEVVEPAKKPRKPRAPKAVAAAPAAKKPAAKKAAPKSKKV
jgi:hypothetical protein